MTAPFSDTSSSNTTPDIITRSTWGAQPFIGTPETLGRVTHVVIHHTATPMTTSRDAAIAQMRAIQREHQQGRKWSDIGYHFVIDAAGRIYQGRPFLSGATLADAPGLAMGAHVRGQNTGKIGICLMGCFHPPGKNCQDVPAAAAIESLTALTLHFCRRFELDEAAVKGHRDFLSTACPGERLYPVLETIRQKLNPSETTIAE